ncbi:MAG: hypothetical protein JO303_07235 [Caulobacteraceae bacterium]|nr:hypothetical protein [Caulobacteraceae bacterium]
MAEDGEHVDAEPRDAAAEAFEQLRGEVAQLRGLVEEMAERLGERVPDYTPTLAAMAQTLTQMERHPALQHTPERFRAENRENLAIVRRQFESGAQGALTMISQAAGDVRRFAGELRSRQAQREALLYAAGGGLVAGAVLWVLLSGPAARALPAGWRVPERMAAATLHMDLWGAGAQLMAVSDPQAWDRVVGADRIARDNAGVLDSCAQAAMKAGKAQPCRVTVSPR